MDASRIGTSPPGPAGLLVRVGSGWLDGSGLARLTPARWVAVGSATAAAGVLALWRFGPTPVLPLYLYLAVLGAALGVVDAAEHRLPDALVLPSYPLCAALGAGWIAQDGIEAWTRGLTAGTGALLVAGLAAAAQPGGLGMGDVKLAGLLGFALGCAGWPAVVLWLPAAFLPAGLFALVLVVSRRADRSTPIALGPWLLAGTWCALALTAS